MKIACQPEVVHSHAALSMRAWKKDSGGWGPGGLNASVQCGRGRVLGNVGRDSRKKQTKPRATEVSPAKESLGISDWSSVN